MFPHLKFSENIIGKARLFGRVKSNQLSLSNKKNRQIHSEELLRKTNQLKADWINHISERDNQGLAPLDKDVEPVFLKINPSLLEDVSFDLEIFQIEIISQEDDGFIIGASLDNLKTLEDKIKTFGLARRGGEIMADFWEIIEGNRESWKPKHILSASLLEKWDTILDEQLYEVEVAVAFDKPIGKEPDTTKKGGPKRLEKYRAKLEKRDDFLMERQNHFERFVN